MHDLLLPRGRSIYHQIMEKLVPLLEKDLPCALKQLTLCSGRALVSGKARAPEDQGSL